MQARNRAFFAALAALLIVVWQLHVSARAGVFFGDFRAFYCAGAALIHGGNPYGASLYSCESTPMPFGLYHASGGVTVPAPLPGYALLPFAALSALPYVSACALWFAVLVIASFLSIRALATLLDRPIAAAVWAFAVGIAIVDIPVGELGPIVLAAILCMCVALRKSAWNWAAVAAVFAMILPHIGLPALLGTAMFIPAMRARIAVVAIVLAVLDVAAGGAHTAIAYVVTVLPAHARAEIGSTAQYGMTWVLHGLGASDRWAIAGGDICYALMIVLGLFAAGRLHALRSDAAYAALIPASFAVFGGTFIHYAQIMIAIPAALLLFDRTRGTTRFVFAAAAVLLAFPWAWVLAQPLLIVAFAIAAAFLVRTSIAPDTAIALRAALASVVICGAVMIAGYHFGTGISMPARDRAQHRDLAQSSWGEYIRSAHAGSGPVWWIAKGPTWVGLALLAASALGLSVIRKSPALAPEAAIAEKG